MQITKVEAFQVQWAPGEKPSQRSAFVRIHTDAGLIGLG
jgi:L-alanine-DL-glutamate epimerase-like enolase superfamily enzyme